MSGGERADFPDSPIEIIGRRVVIPISGMIDCFNIHQYRHIIKKQLSTNGTASIIADLRRLQMGDAGFYAESVRLFKEANLANIEFGFGGPFTGEIHGRLLTLGLYSLIGTLDLNQLETSSLKGTAWH